MPNAIRIHKNGGPEVLQLEQAPDPKPGPGQVLVQIKAAGVNPVDTYIRSGGYAQSPALPYIPGGDAAGVVQGLSPVAPEICGSTRRVAPGCGLRVAFRGGRASVLHVTTGLAKRRSCFDLRRRFWAR